jgi:uncharacterized membrane protein (UPF0127 family)
MGSNARRFRRNVNQALAIIALLVLAAVGYQYLGRVSAEGETATVVFENPDGTKSEEFSLKVARDPGTREKGLMYVKSLPPREGMVFIYPAEDKLTFWMKNTYVPLDMIFVDRSMKVAGILHDVPVLTTDIRSVDKPSRFVVELLAGSAARNKIADGAAARFSSNVQ